MCVHVKKVRVQHSGHLSISQASLYVDQLTRLFVV